MKPSKAYYSFYHILLSLVIVMVIFCNTVVFIKISLFGIELAASGILFPFVFVAVSIVTHQYGHELGERATVLACGSQVCFWILILIFKHFIVSDKNGALFLTLFNRAQIVIFSNTAAFLVSFYVNNFLTSVWKTRFGYKHIWLRLFSSNAFSKAILVSIAYPFAFYGKPYHEIFSIAWHTWVFKIFFGALLLIFAPKVCKIITRFEKVDIYDFKIKHKILNVFSNENIGENEYHENRYYKRTQH